MSVACLIRYQIDPFSRDRFETYARAWYDIIPRLGGRLHGYFLPHEGTSEFAQHERFIVREERTFLKRAI